MTRPLTVLLTFCALLLPSGCANRPLHVGAIQIGRSVNEDSTVGDTCG
jgi:hypothetical protein